MAKQTQNSRRKVFFMAVGACLMLLAQLNNGRAGMPGMTTLTGLSMIGAAGTAGVARGGVQICLAEGSRPPRQVYFDTAQGALVGVYSAFEERRIALSSEELGELMNTVKHSGSRCLEASIDPVADQTVSFVSDELRSARKLSAQILRLDGEIAALLEGAFDLPKSVARTVPLPAEEAQRLLDPRTGDLGYSRLLLAYVKPPHSWHSTTLSVDPGRAAPLDLVMTVKPTATLETPDGRRLQPEPALAVLATRPYAPLAHALAQNPAAFEAVMPALHDGLRYARAFALVSACSRAGRGRCQLDLADRDVTPMEDDELAKLRASLGELTELLQQLHAQRAQVARIGLKSLGLSAVWREHRLAIDPRQLAPEQRIGMFIDETITWYRDLAQAKNTAEDHTQSVTRLRKLLDGVDVSHSPYVGWVDLGRFIVGVWESRGLPELSDALARAYQRALRDQDSALVYQVLRISEQLLPVMQSELLLAAESGHPAAPFVPAFEPTGMLEKKKIVPERYLEHLALSLPGLRARHLEGEYQRLDQQIGALFAPHGGVRANSQEVLAVLARFERSYLLAERSVVSGKPLFQYARLQLAAGQAYAQERNNTEALDRARMLESIAKTATEKKTELDDPTILEVKKWALQIRQQATL